MTVPPLHLDPANRLSLASPPQESLNTEDMGWLKAVWALRRRLILIAAITIGACLISIPFLLGMEKKYYSETRVLIFKTPVVALAEAAEIRLAEVDIVTEVARLGSVENAEAVIAQFDLANTEEFNPELRPQSLISRLLGRIRSFGSPSSQDDPEAQDPFRRVLLEYRDALSIYRQRQSNVVVVSFKSLDPVLAAEVPTAVVETYIAQKEARWKSEVEDAADWLGLRIETAHSLAEATRSELKQAAEKSGEASEDTSTAILSHLAGLETFSARLMQELADIDTILTSIELAQQDLAVPALHEPAILGDLRRELLLQMRDLEDIAATYGEQFEAVVRGRARAEGIRADIRSELAAYARMVELRKSQIVEQAQGVDSNITTARSQLAENQNAARQQEGLTLALREQEELAALLEYRQNSLMAEGQIKLVTLEVLSPAIVPRKPLGPGRKMYLMAVGLVSLIGALTLAGLLELLDNRVRSHEQLTQLSHLVPVGYLPRVEPHEDSSASDPLSWVPDAQFSEFLSSTTFMIEAGNHGDFPSSLLVCPTSDAGSSTLCAHWIAKELIEKGYKVLFVDLNKVADAKDGLTSSPATIGGIVLGQSEKLDKLALHGNDLRDERFWTQMSTLLTEAEAGHYVTIVDAPPLHRLATLRFAQLVEAKLLVMRWGQTTKSEAELSDGLLSKSGIAPAYSVIVDVQPERHSQYGFTDRMTLTTKENSKGKSKIWNLFWKGARNS
jgi:uncharacterized protein involved in exopolysaccharide biosynthesis